MAGSVVLGFDYRGFGGSEETKRRLLPQEQIDDIPSGITSLQAQDKGAPERIGVRGVSFGETDVVGVAPRAKVAVGQAGLGDGERLIGDVRSYGEQLELTQALGEIEGYRKLPERDGKPKKLCVTHYELDKE